MQAIQEGRKLYRADKSEVKDRLDVLIELGGQINEHDTDYLKQRGTR